MNEVILKQYYDKHKACPKCGSSNSIQTYVGYVLNLNEIDNYVDENLCECTDCGDKHIVHNRVSSILLEDENEK